MNANARIRIEEKITGLLDKVFEGEGNQELNVAMDLAVLEYDNRNEIIPILKAVFDSCDSVDEVLMGWANILDDFADVA
ncbi:hypothetical protein [Ulvibacterium marinum]|nr:hypothetical protein [Ulvibacterium marinum]